MDGFHWKLLGGAFALWAAGLVAGPPESLAPGPTMPAGPVLQWVAGEPQACDDASPPAGDDDLDDLTIVLTNWTRIGAAVETLEGSFQRYTYDTAAGTEQVAIGRIHFEAGTRALYSVQSRPVPAGARSNRLRTDGKPFQLAEDRTESLYWVHGQFARINPVRREFELFEVPQTFQTTAAAEVVDSFDIVWTRLGCLQRSVPGLVETDLAAIRQRYTWTLEGIDETRVILTGRPLATAEKRLYSALHVHLDAETYITRATKLINSTGTQEVIHVFEGLKFNQPPGPNQPDWAPDLGRMNLLTAPPLAPPSAGP